MAANIGRTTQNRACEGCAAWLQASASLGLTSYFRLSPDGGAAHAPSPGSGKWQMNVFTETDNPAASEREHLILGHLRQVKLIARRIHDRLPGNVSLDDLVSAGMLGLIAAIDRFDASRDVTLRTYAEHKIKARSWTVCGN